MRARRPPMSVRRSTNGGLERSRQPRGSPAGGGRCGAVRSGARAAGDRHRPWRPPLQPCIGAHCGVEAGDVERCRAGERSPGPTRLPADADGGARRRRRRPRLGDADVSRPQPHRVGERARRAARGRGRWRALRHGRHQGPDRATGGQPGVRPRQHPPRRPRPRSRARDVGRRDTDRTSSRSARPSGSPRRREQAPRCAS